MRRANKIILVLLGVVIVGVILVFFKVNEGEYAIVLQFGKPVRTILEPGLYAKLPSPIQTVKRFDKRIQVYESKLVEYLTQDKRTLVVQPFVGWRIVDPLKFFQSVGTVPNAQQKLDDMVSAAIGATISNYPMDAIITTEEGGVKIEEIEENVTKQVDEKARESYGISVVKVGINRLSLPPDNAESVYKRMMAERHAIANRYRAEGEEQAAQIKAEAERERARILAEAYSQAEKIKGEGDAEAARIYAQAYSQDPEFYKFFRVLEAYKKVLAGRSTLVLSSDSDLFRYLNEKDLLKGLRGEEGGK